MACQVSGLGCDNWRLCGSCVMNSASSWSACSVAAARSASVARIATRRLMALENMMQSFVCSMAKEAFPCGMPSK